MSIEHPDRTGKSDETNQEPEGGQPASPRFAKVRSFGVVIGQSQGYQRAKRAYQHSSKWAYWPFKAFGTKLLSDIGWARVSISSNQIIAIFTVVMAFTTWLQWSTMVEQNRAFIEQNKMFEVQTNTLIDQNIIAQKQLNRVEEQNTALLEQTDAMRLEQRAWLGVGGPKVSQCQVGKPLVCNFVMINSGQTPGKMTSIGYAIGIVNASELRDEDAVMRKVKVVSQARSAAIPPNGNSGFPCEGNAVKQEEFDGVTAGTMCIVLAGRLNYLDTTKTARETRFSLMTDGPGAPEGRELLVTADGNDMN